MKATKRWTIFISKPIDAYQRKLILKELRDWQWVYFGKEASHLYRLKQVFKNEDHIFNASQSVNDIAHDIRTEFINFDQHFAFVGSQLLCKLLWCEGINFLKLNMR